MPSGAHLFCFTQNHLARTVVLKNLIKLNLLKTSKLILQFLYYFPTCPKVIQAYSPPIPPSCPCPYMTLTLMIQDSGPFSHRTMFRFSKLKLIGLGGLGMVPIRSLLWQKLELASVVWDGAKQIVNVTIYARHSGLYIEGNAAQCLSSLLLKESTDGAVTTLSGRLFQRFTTLFAK